jgi:hypothetical protein
MSKAECRLDEELFYDVEIPLVEAFREIFCGKYVDCDSEGWDNNEFNAVLSLPLEGVRPEEYLEAMDLIREMGPVSFNWEVGDDDQVLVAIGF